MTNDGGKAMVAILCGGAGLLVGFLFGLLVGARGAQSSERAEAVKASVARYTADAKTGETKFVYGKGD